MAPLRGVVDTRWTSFVANTTSESLSDDHVQTAYPSRKIPWIEIEFGISRARNAWGHTIAIVSKRPVLVKSYLDVDVDQLTNYNRDAAYSAFASSR
jgi:hypothetical protein